MKATQLPLPLLIKSSISTFLKLILKHLTTPFVSLILMLTLTLHLHLTMKNLQKDKLQSKNKFNKRRVVFLAEKESELIKNKVERQEPEKHLKCHKKKNMIQENIGFTEVSERHQTILLVQESKYKTQWEQESEKEKEMILNSMLLEFYFVALVGRTIKLLDLNLIIFEVY